MSQLDCGMSVSSRGTEKVCAEMSLNQGQLEMKLPAMICGG